MLPKIIYSGKCYEEIIDKKSDSSGYSLHSGRVFCSY